MTRKEQIERCVADAIAEKPLRFSVVVPFEFKSKKERLLRKLLWNLWRRHFEQDVRHFEIAPPTLGKMQLLSQLYLDLEISEEDLQANPTSTVMAICAQRTEICAKMMALATLSTRKEILDDKLVSERAEFFKWTCQPDDMAKVIIALISHVHYENFLNSIALTKILRLNEPTQIEGTDAVE